MHGNIRKWIEQQKRMALHSLKQGKHHFVIVSNHGNGENSVVVNCCICHRSVRLHLLNRHYQISNWTSHVKRCTSYTSRTTDSRQTKLQLFPKISSSTIKIQSSPTKQSVSVSKSNCKQSICSNDPASNNLDSKSSSTQVFAKPSFIKPGVRGLWPRVPGFLKLFLSACWYARVCMCACACVCGH